MSEAQRNHFQPHLDACADCREAVREFAEQWTEYLRFHEFVLKPAIAEPPRPWRSLDQIVERSDTHPGRWRGVPLWSAIAAAVLAAVAAIQILRRPAAVSAAELLQNAVAAEASVKPSDAKIRIAARGRSWVRPALLSASSGNSESSTDRDLRQRFEAAHYDWQRPLSARAFSTWRDRLPRKRDEVTKLKSTATTEGVYRVRTSTDSGELVQASLSLREKDLLPVAGQWQFRDLAVDMAHVSSANTADARGSAVAPAAPAVTRQPEERPVGPAEELRVLAALHQINADLGEEITVSRGQKEIIVQGFGLDAHRRDQVRGAVAGIDGVVVEIDKAAAGSAVRPRPRIQTGAGDGNKTSPLHSEIETKLSGDTSAEELINQVLEASDNALARAFALRSLATRFDPSVEGQLTPPDHALLASLRQDHVRALSQQLERMLRLMEPVYAGMPAPPPGTPAQIPAAWQDGAAEVLSASRRLDQVLNRAFAGSGGGSIAEVREAMLELQRTVANYQRH